LSADVLGTTPMLVHFYLHPAQNSHELHYAACGLGEQAYRRGLSVYFLCGSLRQAQQLDALLWTYAEDRFLPHQLYVPDSNSRIPLQIGYPEILGCPAADVLINMSEAVPAFYSQFNRVVELIPQEATQRQLARAKYRHYQHEQCEVVTQNVGIVPALPAKA
jgi:DNA polymerase-3 subunit chi